MLVQDIRSTTIHENIVVVYIWLYLFSKSVQLLGSPRNNSGSFQGEYFTVFVQFILSSFIFDDAFRHLIGKLFVIAEFIFVKMYTTG